MIDSIKENVSYDPISGKFMWKSNVKKPMNWNSRFAGKPAFLSNDTNGYLCGRVNYTRMLAHRVAWALYYGKWPDGQIDHINGIVNDNRIENLRDVTISQNQWNRKENTNNTSGMKWVCWSKKENKWVSHIFINGKQIRLGCFLKIEDAGNAYKLAASKLHKGYTRAT